MDSIVTAEEREIAAQLRAQVESPEGDIALEAEVLGPMTDPQTCPLFVESFEELPPAYVITAGLDVLRDEGLLFVRRMRQWARNAGITPRVGHKHYANYGHGFMTGMGTNEVQRDLVRFLEAHPGSL